MPELPEVEIVRRGLEKFLIGKQIREVEVRVPKLFVGDTGHIAGAHVTHILRRAKVLILQLDNQVDLLVHLKMTGQLVYQSSDEKEKVVGGHPQASYNQPLPHKHSHVIFRFADGGTLYFNDLRKFGWIQESPRDKTNSFSFFLSVGPEPLEDAFTLEVFKERIGKYPNRVIFQSLLDQELVAGIGNIYANEALYEADVLPERRVKDITASEWNKLWIAVRHVLSASIEYGGTSDNTFIGVDGKRGDYLKHAHVYHKKLAVPCGHEVVRKKIGGRTSHFCLICQR